MSGSCEVDMDDRKVDFALVLRSDKEGMSITFGWWRAEVKHLGKFSHSLIFLGAAACIFLMADSGIESTAMTKWKEGTRYLLYIHSLYSPGHAPCPDFQFLLENLSELLPAWQALDLYDEVWGCPRNLVGPEVMFLVNQY